MDIPIETDENEVKELAKELEMVSPNEGATSASNATMDESFVMGNPKNPLLLSPVIQCLLKFLNFEEMKNFRLVCREWGSTGKYSLASRTQISFDNHKKSSRIRRPADFQSCFLESAALFCAFKISGGLTKKSAKDPWTTGELTKFFHEQKKYIKEVFLNFELSDKKIVEKIDLGSWLSESPMVKKDAKHMTKLWIERHGKMFDVPLHLIMHIKDLSLSNCRISLSAGIKICPIKLGLSDATFYRGGIKVVRVLLNDIMDFSNAKEVSLFCSETEETLADAEEDATIYSLDLWGNVNLEILSLSGVKTVNGGRSLWGIRNMRLSATPYALNSQMKIKELSFSVAYTDIIDLSTLPTSIQKLILYEVGGETTLICSHPLVLQNLEHLEIVHPQYAADFSFLSHFTNCPQLTSLCFYDGHIIKINTIWMPRSLKIISLENSIIKWSGDSNWSPGTLLIDWSFAKDHCKAKIKVDDVVMIWDTQWDLGKSLVDFLDDQKRLNFGKRLFIGQLKWGEKKLEDSVLNGRVDDKSSFYIFQNGEMGGALSEEAFHQLVDIPKDIYDKGN